MVKERNDHNIWEIIDTLTGTKKKSNSALQSIANLKCDGNINTLAEIINESFQSISIDLPKIPHPQPLEASHVPDKFIISVTDMEKCLMCINIRKTPGPAGVPNWVLRDFAPNLGGRLASIVNSSICESFVPEICRRCHTSSKH